MHYALTLALALLLAGCSEYRCADNGDVEQRLRGNDYWTFYQTPKGGCHK